MVPTSASSRKIDRLALALACALALIASASPARAQDACDGDDDCDGELVCTRVLFGVDCAEGECLEVLEQGFCGEPAPQPLRCDDMGQCPAPLHCDADNPAGPLCAYVEPMCGTGDDECPSGFMCVDLEPLGGCETCEESEDGPVCADVPCAENLLNVCSPRAVACDDDGDCMAGFVCREVDALELPLGWDAELADTRACLSVGLLAVDEGLVQGGDDVLPGEPGEPDGGVSGGSGGASGASGGASGAGAGTGGASGEGDADADAGAEPAKKRSSSGCTVHEGSGSRLLSFGLLFALFVGAFAVRRWPVG